MNELIYNWWHNIDYYDQKALKAKYFKNQSLNVEGLTREQISLIYQQETLKTHAIEFAYWLRKNAEWMMGAYYRKAFSDVLESNKEYTLEELYNIFKP